jgi:hypothetical protein
MNELERLKRVLCEIAELRSELLRRRKSSGEAEIETLYTTPAAIDDQAILESARETFRALTRLNAELRKSLEAQNSPGI